MSVLIEILVSFGPIAFGTVVLITLWRAIVKPELDTRRIEMKAFESQVKALADLNQGVKHVAELQSANQQSLATLVTAQRELVREMRETIFLCDRHRTEAHQRLHDQR